MLRQFALPFVCLAFGGAAGFFTGRNWDDETTRPKPVMDAAKSLASPAQQVNSTNIRQAGLSGALTNSLDELVKDYDPKDAERLAGTLSIAQIQQALQHLALRPGSEGSALRAQLYRAWAAKDPEAAWKHAMTISDTQARRTALNAVATELSKTRPEAAIDLAMSLGMGSSRSHVLDGVWSEWAKRDLRAAVGYLKEHPDLPITPYFMGALAQSARDNPQLALEQALSIPNANARENAVSQVVRSWFERDPAAAKAWALSLSDPALRNKALRSLLENMAQNDPTRALAALDEFGLSADQRRQALSNIFYQWVTQDPAAAFDYFINTPDAKTQEQLKYALSSSMRYLTSDEQSSLLARLPEGNLKHEVISNMASNHVSNGRYAEAVTALNTLPDSTNRDSALQRLGSSWARDNPQAVAAWLSHQPDSTDRDLVIAGFAQEVVHSDPQAAVRWANAIPDKTIQEATFKNIAVRWLQFNSRAASSWLRTLNLSQNDVDQIVKYAGEGSNTTFGFNVKARR